MHLMGNIGDKGSFKSYIMEWEVGCVSNAKKIVTKVVCLNTVSSVGVR